MVQVAVKRAVYEWACRVQVNFIVDSIPTSINIDTSDGVNVIHFVNSFPYNDTTTLARTRITPGNCLNTNNVRIFFPTDIDIAILETLQLFLVVQAGILILPAQHCLKIVLIFMRLHSTK